ncbi:MAG TPA: hypothetical protein VNP04_08740 [Alphaproteobacteria bacterium]|nr:hypothetical protein [Alphaproteobacteria bacterium]
MYAKAGKLRIAVVATLLVTMFAVPLSPAAAGHCCDQELAPLKDTGVSVLTHAETATPRQHQRPAPIPPPDLPSAPAPQPPEPPHGNCIRVPNGGFLCQHP